ncbi:hypothetical protein [Methylobacterium sp. 285MFTsu5.1]|uniref:hypothetical protein n=1 Tax=Methylobacterium sp. 285MFTsu5.1 TaxID=1172187 RepID=UPI001319DC30|nr:hypothetical protein [Methylobacterium sp. 285MFTsu5.1]
MAKSERRQSFELSADEIAGFSHARDALEGALKHYGVDLPDQACAEIFMTSLVAFVSYGGLDGPTRRYLKNVIKPENVDPEMPMTINYKTSRPEHS